MTHGELLEMEVPPEMAEVHRAVLAGTGDCDASMEYLPLAIDNLDIEELNRAILLMRICSTKQSEARDVLVAAMK